MKREQAKNQVLPSQQQHWNKGR